MDSYTELEQQLSFKFDPNIWKKLWPVIRMHKRQLITMMVVMTLSSIIDIALPIFNRYAINNFVVPGTVDGLQGFGALYIATLLAQTAILIIFFRICMVVEMNLGKELKRRAFIHLQRLPFSYYNQTPVGWMIARVMSDTNRISALVAWSAIDLFWSGFYIIGAFVVMAIVNLRLALMVVVVVPLLAVLTLLFEGKLLTVNRKVRSINSKITGAYNEGITGAKTSKSLVIEGRNYSEFSRLSNEMYVHSNHMMKLNAVFVPLGMLLTSIAAATVMNIGGGMALSGAMDLGTLTLFIGYAYNLLDPVQQIASVIAEFIATQVNIERVTGLLETPCEIEDAPEVVEKYGDMFNPKRENWEPLNGEIEFKNIWFMYSDGDENILEDFSLKIPKGTNVALVGETGAGKSTLVNLACRFFEPTKGEILIDGVDYKKRSQLWLHSHIGYVLQTPHLFSGSVMENIRYGRLDATDEEVKEAARLVSADIVIEKMENGYDTNVGEGGDRLSTGEKQLISFARAILADPPIFVLDEATSSVDTVTEQLIQNAISHILGGRTSFLIAHRLSTIRHADLILVVRDGKIVQQGSHDELMEQGGYYKNLYLQMQLDQGE